MRVCVCAKKNKLNKNMHHITTSCVRQRQLQGEGQKQKARVHYTKPKYVKPP